MTPENSSLLQGTQPDPLKIIFPLCFQSMLPRQGTNSIVCATGETISVGTSAGTVQTLLRFRSAGLSRYDFKRKLTAKFGNCTNSLATTRCEIKTSRVGNGTGRR